MSYLDVRANSNRYPALSYITESLNESQSAVYWGLAQNTMTCTKENTTFPSHLILRELRVQEMDGCVITFTLNINFSFPPRLTICRLQHILKGYKAVQPPSGYLNFSAQIFWAMNYFTVEIVPVHE